MKVCYIYRKCKKRGGDANRCFKLMSSVFETAAICKVDLHKFVLLTLNPKKARYRSLTESHADTEGNGQVHIQRMTHTAQTCVFNLISPQILTNELINMTCSNSVFV